LHVIGATKPRKGLPFVCSKSVAPSLRKKAAQALLQMGACAP